MSNKTKSPVDDIKVQMFGYNKAEVAQLVEISQREQARISSRLEALQNELSRAQAEIESRHATESQLVSQLNSLRDELDASRAAFQTEVNQMREALSAAQATSPVGGTEAGADLELRENYEILQRQAFELHQELEAARIQAAEYPVLLTQVESLRNQVFELENRPLVSHEGTGTGAGNGAETEMLRAEIAHLREELAVVPELREQIARAQMNDGVAELQRAVSEIERLQAELTNVPGLLQEIDGLREQLAASALLNNQQELEALRAEVERLHSVPRAFANSAGYSTAGDVDLDRSLIEARRILDNAREEAARERELIIETAHHHAEEVVRRAQRQFSTEAWEIEKIRLERRRYLSMFKALLNRHLHEVEELEVDGNQIDVNQAPSFVSVVHTDGPENLRFSSQESEEEFRSPFSYPQADEPFHA